MRAFLSHSSKNKEFVRQVFEDLGAALAEFDERTFDGGLFNVEAISQGLTRCSLFVLFATKDSLESGYVDIEIKLAQEALARKKISKIITFCLGDAKPSDLPDFIGSISAVRRLQSPGAIARSIRSEIIQSISASGRPGRPFVGRDSVARSIKEKLSDPEKSTPLALAISGVDGVGRRTLARKVFQDIYPYLGVSQPELTVINGAGASELFRDILAVEGAATKAEVFERIKTFEELSASERTNALCLEIVRISEQNQVLFMIDEGGLLAPDGSFSQEIKAILEGLAQFKFAQPPLCFILFRTPPAKSRERTGVIYFKIDGLQNEDMRMLISLHLKRMGMAATIQQVEALASLLDGHPYNLEFLIDLLGSKSIDSILDSPSDLLAFKKRQGDEFFAKVSLPPVAIKVLGVLRVLGPSSVETLGHIRISSEAEVGNAIRDLEDSHCAERVGNVISINRPLRAAIERSSTLRMSPSEVKKIQEAALELFKSFSADEEVSVSLISTAARAAAVLNDQDEHLRIFLSPANSVLVARQLYDVKKYADCARTCGTALAASRFITEDARVEALRLQCLSFARLGMDDDFEKSVSKLNLDREREKALSLFLKGFRKRLSGYPFEASELYQQSLAINQRSFSALREMSHVLLLQGRDSDAKKYSSAALAIAPTNPYVIDQALAILISEKAKIDSYIFYDPEVEDLLDRLRRYGDDDGMSFYSIRMADIYRRMGDFPESIKQLQRAKELNPSHVPAYVMECEILFKSGAEISIISARIRDLQALVDDGKSGEGKSNLPELLKLKIQLLLAEDKVSDAINLLKASEGRLSSRAADLKKEIAHFIASNGSVLSRGDIEYIKRG